MASRPSGFKQVTVQFCQRLFKQSGALKHMLWHNLRNTAGLLQHVAVSDNYRVGHEQRCPLDTMGQA